MTTAERLAAHGIPDYLADAHATTERRYGASSHCFNHESVGNLLDIIERLASDPPAPEAPEALRYLDRVVPLDNGEFLVRCKQATLLPDEWEWRHGADARWRIEDFLPTGTW